MHKVLDDLKNVAKDQLKEIVDKKDMTPTELKNAKDAVCLIKEIQEVEEGMNYGGEMSSRSYQGSYYGDWASNRRGRDAATGQYTGRRSYGSDMESYPSRNYDMARSGHSIKDRMVDRLESMMDEAKTEYEREEVRRMINQIEMGN